MGRSSASEPAVVLVVGLGDGRMEREEPMAVIECCRAAVVVWIEVGEGVVELVGGIGNGWG